MYRAQYRENERSAMVAVENTVCPVLTGSWISAWDEELSTHTSRSHAGANLAGNRGLPFRSTKTNTPAPHS